MLSLSTEATRDRNGLLCGVLATVFVACNIAPSKSATQTSTTGACSPIAVNTGGVTSIEVKCPIQVSNNVTYQLDSATANALAAHFAVSNEAIVNFFKKLDGENVPPYELVKRLNSLVVEVKRLRAQLEAVSVNPNSQSIWKQAVKALEQGRIDDAIALHVEILNLNVKNVEAAFNTLLDAVRLKRSLGDLYMLTHKYDEAAEVFKSALLMLPSQFSIESARLKTDYADALLLGNGTPDQVSNSTQEALLATNKIQDIDPETRLKALGIAVRVLISLKQVSDALDLFNKSVAPLLKRPELAGSSWATFCIACAGSALVDLRDYEGAITLLEAGLEFSNKQIAPDKLALSAIYFHLSAAYQKTDKEEQAGFSLQKSKTLLVEAFPDERHPDLAQLYLEIANRTDNALERDKATQRAFEINASIFPHTHDTYQQTLRDVLEERSYKLPIPGNLTIGGPELSSEAISNLYDIHMANVKRFEKDVESQAQASNLFAFLLDESGKYDEAWRTFQKTVSLYPESAAGRNAGVARFNVGRYLLYLNGEDASIELNLREALRIYNQALGNLSEESSDVRTFLVKFYGSRSRIKEAEKLIADFLSSVAINPTPNEVTAHATGLRQLLVPPASSK